MSDPTAAPPTAPTPPDSPAHEHRDGFLPEDPTGDDGVNARIAAIEMAGEEVAVGWKPGKVAPLAPEVRYLHESRTIHQIISDRNRSVGIFLLVASVLINASAGLIQSDAKVNPIIPMQSIRYWCLPVTFATLGVLGLFTSLLVIRLRIGLIYEVVKMNVLLGLPAGRVERVNPLSVFYLMHLMVVMAGGASAGFTCGMLRLPHVGPADATWQGIVVGLLYVFLLQALYYVTILRATTETKLKLKTKA